MSKARTSVNDINARERMNQALSLRKAGATLDAISKACGYGSRSSAHKAIRRAMNELPRENAEDLRQLELERLDELMLAHWRNAKVDVQAGHLVLKIIAQRCTLLGLNIDPSVSEARNTVVIREVPMGYLGITEEKEQAS